MTVPVLAVVAASPMLATAARALGTWRPVGDTAAITLRSLDVLTRHSPLVGMPTTLSDAVGHVLHHPGPIEFWAIAAVQAVTGHRVAPMVAVVGVNLAAVVAIVVLAGWIGGRGGRVGAALLVALATWSLRGDYVIDPYNPYAAWLPLAAFAVAVAAAVGGRSWALPVAVVAGSYAAQSHVSLVVPVGVTGLVAVVLVALDARGRDRAAAAAWTRLRMGVGEHRRPLLAAGVAAIVAWAPVVVDMVAGRRNLLTLVGATGADGPILGLSRAWQVVARAVTSPPWLVADRGPFETVAPVSMVQQAAAALVLVVALVLAASAWRRHRGAAALVGVAVSGLAGGMFAASRIPGGIFAAYALHNYLWLWPFTAVLWAGLVGAATVHAPAPVPPRLAGRALALGAVVLVGVATVGVVPPPVRASVLAGRHGPATAALGTQVAAVLGAGSTGGPVVIDIEAELDQSAVAMGLVLELERRGIDARVDPGLGGSFGGHRVVAPDSAVDRLFTRVGRTGPPLLPDDAEVVGVHQPEAGRLAHLDAANRELLDFIHGGGGLVLATESGVVDPARTVELVEGGDLVGLGRLDLIVQPRIPDDVFARYADAQEGPILFVTVYRLPPGDGLRPG